jgi:hypothetical protein
MDGGRDSSGVGVGVGVGGDEVAGVRGAVGEVGVGGGEISVGDAAGGDVGGATPSSTMGWKLIFLKAQSTNGLCRVSQFNPKIMGQDVPSGVTKNVNGVTFPQANRSGMRTSCVMTALDVPSISTSFFGGVGRSGSRHRAAQWGSTKECEDPQSSRADQVLVRTGGAETGTRRESEAERADALSRIISIGA